MLTNAISKQAFVPAIVNDAILHMQTLPERLVGLSFQVTRVLCLFPIVVPS